MIGKTLAHYEITSQLGKGGMGEVYQAKDKKLGRDVAIKVLPEEFAKDADRVTRFQREAKVLASLNHPNIATIHGLEESGGINFLVLELVQGDTLADRIKTGPIPVEESLKLALQIAEALEAAHEKGVIHRDLKPANIKVTPEGKVKVLDFGLAKAFAGEQENLNLSNSPTLSNAATQQGVILGTAAYMSPEQAKGKSVDKRADIWAFGVVLFEMLTGRQVFTGETVSDTLASVLAREPAWTNLPPNLHPRIRLLLERCLEKDPRDRYGSINDARVDVQKALFDPSGVLVKPNIKTEPKTRLRQMLPWLAAALLLGMVVAGFAVWILKSPEPREVTSMTDTLPKDQQFNDLFMSVLALSPDGRRLAYSTRDGLCLRRMEEPEGKLIAGTDNCAAPFFSPDGKWIGYFSRRDSTLKKIPVGGGVPVTLCAVSGLAAASWGTTDAIVYGDRGCIMQVSPNGGPPVQIAKLPENEIPLYVQMMPEGKSMLYTLSGRPWKIMVLSLKSGERKELFEGRRAKYLPTGHIVYGLNSNLLAVAFDPKALRATAGPVSVVAGVLQTGAAQYAVSDSGTLAYVPGMGGTPALRRTLVWVDRKGKEEPLAAAADDYRSPKISPEGTPIALSLGARGVAIYVLNIVRGTLTQLTIDPSWHSSPLWTPDGKRIAFFSTREAISGIYWKAADGTGKDELLFASGGRVISPSSWSRDGKTLAVTEAFGITTTSIVDIGAISIEGGTKYKPLLKEKYSEGQPQISPDGKWMAYTSDESGRAEIYVRPFPGVEDGKWQLTREGGDNPLWSPDGGELFYRSGDGIMAISVKYAPVFSFDTPRMLFRGAYDRLGWDIHPDNKRFLMMKEGEPTYGKINIVLNWTEELKQKVPAK